MLLLDIDEVREILWSLAFRYEVAYEYGDTIIASRTMRVYNKLKRELKAQGVEI